MKGERETEGRIQVNLSDLILCIYMAISNQKVFLFPVTPLYTDLAINLLLVLSILVHLISGESKNN